MFVQFTYDQEFNNLIMYLQEKYPSELFNLEGIGDQLDLNKFSRKFFSSKVTADASIDANANVPETTVITYAAELPKPFEKLNSYYMLWKQLRRLYDTQFANTVIEMQLTGDIYINDMRGIGGSLSYCWNFSTYDIMIQGLPMVTKIHSVPPKHLYAFKSQLEQFIAIASNSILGAAGISDMLVVFSYYAKQLIRNLSDGHFKFASVDDAWNFIKESLVSLIYTLNQPFRGGIQCVTEDTEVLTPDGWKSYKTLRVDDPIYTWHDGELRIQNVQRINISEYDGIMHRWYSPKNDFEQVVTPNHRVLYKRYNEHKYELKSSEELSNNTTPISIPIVPLEFNCDDYTISDNLLELLTIILCDGSIDLSTNRISIFKSDKRFGNERIIELLNSLEIRFSHSKHLNQIDLSQGKNVNVYRFYSNECMQLLNYTKNVIPDWFTQLNKRQSKLVIDTWKKFDGYERVQDSSKLQCDNYEIADSLQHVALRAGLGTHIHEKLIGTNKNPTIYVYTYSNVNKTVHFEEVNYKGIVWCPTTDDGVVIYRKNGFTFISGNSPYTNVSIYDRVFLEQMQSNYIFPDGSTIDIEFVTELQDLFIDIINEELKRTPLTFPVLSACIAVDDERNILDPAFLYKMCEKNLEFGFINFFAGKSSTISSCCFTADQKLYIKETPESKEQLVEIGRYIDCMQPNQIVYVSSNGEWKQAKAVKCKPCESIYMLTLSDDTIIKATGDHIFPTNNGNKRVDALCVSDMLITDENKFMKVKWLDELPFTSENVYCFELLDQSYPFFTLPNGIITHNCRLRSDMTKMDGYGYTNSIGGSSTKIGSIGVVTLNLPRMAIRSNGDVETFMSLLSEYINVSVRINNAKRHIVQNKIDAGVHPLYSLGFIDISKQYFTTGINGLYEALEFMGLDILTAEGQQFILDMMKIINTTNLKCDKMYTCHCNVEQIPKRVGDVKSSLIYGETLTRCIAC